MMHLSSIGLRRSSIAFKEPKGSLHPSVDAQSAAGPVVEPFIAGQQPREIIISCHIVGAHQVLQWPDCI